MQTLFNFIYLAFFNYVISQLTQSKTYISVPFIHCSIQKFVSRSFCSGCVHVCSVMDGDLSVPYIRWKPLELNAPADPYKTWKASKIMAGQMSRCICSDHCVLHVYTSNPKADTLEKDTDPGAFDLLVNLIELQCVSHVSHRRGLMLCRHKRSHWCKASRGEIKETENKQNNLHFDMEPGA